MTLVTCPEDGVTFEQRPNRNPDKLRRFCSERCRNRASARRRDRSIYQHAWGLKTGRIRSDDQRRQHQLGRLAQVLANTAAKRDARSFHCAECALFVLWRGTTDKRRRFCSTRCSLRFTYRAFRDRRPKWLVRHAPEGIPLEEVPPDYLTTVTLLHQLNKELQDVYTGTRPSNPR